MALSDEIRQDIDKLAAGLRDADAAGEVDRARKLANAYKNAKRRLETIESNPAEYDVGSDAYNERYGPQAVSGVQNFFAGFGKGITDVGRGIQQLGVDAANLIPGVDLDDESERLRQRASDVREQDAPLMSTGAGLTGNIAGNLTTTLAPVGVGVRAASGVNALRGAAGIGRGFLAPNSIRAALGAGAVQGAITPVAQGESRGVNTALGAGSSLAGYGLSQGLSRLSQPVRRALSPRQADAADLLRREGVDLDVAQRTGSESAQRVRSAMADNPITARRAQEFAENQQRQFTRAVLRTAGINADEVSPDVLLSAYDDVGNAIDDAVRSRPPRVDQKLLDDIQTIKFRAPAEVGDDGALRALRTNIDRIEQAQINGTIPPDVFISTRSSLGQLSRKTPLARDFQESLMDALERTQGGASQKLRDALARFRNIKIIEDAVDKDVDRLISPLRLSNAVQTKRNRALSLRGLGHPSSVKMTELAAAGRTFIPETVGNSGTATRLLTQNAMLGAGGFGGALLSGQDVSDAAAIGVAAAALPPVVQRAMMSQGRLGGYLAQGGPQILQQTLNNPILRAALTQGGASAGLAGQR